MATINKRLDKLAEMAAYIQAAQAKSKPSATVYIHTLFPLNVHICYRQKGRKGCSSLIKGLSIEQALEWLYEHPGVHLFVSFSCCVEWLHAICMYNEEYSPEQRETICVSQIMEWPALDGLYSLDDPLTAMKTIAQWPQTWRV